MTGKRILVMEDDDDLVELYREALGLSGYEVDGVTTIGEARHHLENNQYAVFLCDLFIGRERSIDLLREVLPTLKETQIVMLTGSGQGQMVAQEIGIDFFLAKPVSLPELLSLVDRLAR
ncbi:MAG: response regulator [Anaerolineae bacterium]|nr:response regulator [Anaerolineae bacterium]